MPFILKNKSTSQVFTCKLINNYNIPFYGTKFWDNPYEAEKEQREFLEAAQVEQLEDWLLTEVEEHQLKIFNVKLNNNPSKTLFMDEDGRAVIRTSPEKPPDSPIG